MKRFHDESGDCKKLGDNKATSDYYQGVCWLGGGLAALAPPHIGGWGALARIDDCDNSQTPTLCLFFLVFALTCPSQNQQIQVALSATSWRAP